MKEDIKKYVKTSIIFMIITLVVEVAILITTKAVKWDNVVSGRPWAVAAHVHLMVLGAVWFLVMALLEKNFRLSQVKLANAAYIVYLVGLSLVVSLILYKGFTQLAGGTVIRGLAEGGAAIAHVTLFVGLFMWARVIWKAVASIKDEKGEENKEN